MAYSKVDLLKKIRVESSGTVISENISPFGWLSSRIENRFYDKSENNILSLVTMAFPFIQIRKSITRFESIVCF